MEFIGIGLAMGLAALGIGLGQGIGLSKGLEGISRQPEATSKIQTAMIVGMALMETIGILTFVIAIIMSNKLYFKFLKEARTLDINKHQDLLTINWNLVFSIITVLVLILILKRFFFEKVKRFMDERKAQVEAQFQKADEAENQARKKLDEYNDILAGAEKEKRAIIAGAMESAKVQADSVLDEARKEAADIREKSRIQIEREKVAARKEIHNEASELAVQVAEKILENKLDADAQASVIDEIISRSEANSETEK